MVDQSDNGHPAGTQSGPLSLPEVLKQAYAHWNSRNGRQAEELALRVLARQPKQPSALNLLSLIAYARGNLDQAIAYLQTACQAPGAPAGFFSNLGEMLRQRGLLEPAEKAARRAVELDDSMPGAWGNLGIVLQESGKLDESRRCLERALKLDPDNAEIHNNLGNTLKRSGVLQEAESHWARAIALRPEYAEPHSNLALLWIDQGDADRAAAEARKAIDLNPRLADAYVNLSSAETARQRYGEALRWLDALMNFAPNYPAGLTARALALKQVDRIPEALATARRAVAVAPRNGEAHNALGQILQATGNFDDAMAAFDRAAQLPGTATERALINRAVVYMEHGHAAEAETAFAQAAAAFPRSASAWFNRSDLVKFTKDDPVIRRMEASLASEPPISQTDRMLFHFALGKAYLDIGDSDKAFLHLNEGNRLKRTTIKYDPEQTSRTMASLAEVFSSDLLGRMGGRGTRSELPVFVVGMPRSGTTLIEQILASHPNVHGAGELRYLQHVVDAVRDYPRGVPQLTAEELEKLGNSYLSRIQRLAGGRARVIDKMPANFLHLGMIRLILPDARIIHCRRNAADTCLSCYSKLFQSEQNFTYNLAELGRFHWDYQRLMTHWRGVLPASNFLEIDYEAVVEDTEAEAKRILQFLDLPWDPAVLEFYRASRSVRTASMNQVRRPVYKSSAGRWKKHKAHLGPLLAELELTGTPSSAAV